MKYLVILFAPLLASSSYADGIETVTAHTSSVLKDSVDKTGLWIIGTGTALTVVAHQFDHSTRAAWRDHHYMSAKSTKIGELWGSGLSQILIFGVQLYYDKDNAIPGIEGVLIGNAIAQATKYAIRRERPNAEETVSFPSGHTQASFSMATSLTMSYGWRKALPLWAMAAFTGLSRISDNQHWLSDVTAGATIGVLFGRAGFAHHQQIQPTVFMNEGTPNGLGVAINTSW